MKLNRSTSSLCVTAAFLLVSRVGPASSDELYRAPRISNVIDGVVFEAGIGSLISRRARRRICCWVPVRWGYSRAELKAQPF